MNFMDKHKTIICYYAQLRKIQSPDNKKRIEIELLEPAKKVIQEGLSVQKEFVKDLFQGLSEEELRMWQSIFVKVCNNAERCLKEK